MVQLPAAYANMILVLSIPGLFCLMLVLGRWLKRKRGVRLSYWIYLLFSACVAIYFPAELFSEDLNVDFFGHEQSMKVVVGAFSCLLGAVVVIALVDRYIWDLYFKQKHRVKV